MTGDWLADGNIEVDIHQLEDFANHIKAELDKNFQPSFKSGIQPFMHYAAHISAPGAHGIKEGGFFEARHNESKQALGAMMAEAMKGLLALSLAAKSIAAEYSDGDALVKATHDDVFDAFNGVHGKQTLNDILQQTQEQPGGDKGSGGTDQTKIDDDLKKYGQETDQAPIAGHDDRTTEIGTGSGQYVVPADNEKMHDQDVQPKTPKK